MVVIGVLTAIREPSLWVSMLVMPLIGARTVV